MICDKCLDKFKDYMKNLVSIAEAHYVSEIKLLITFGTDEELRKMPWLHCHCNELI
jgi:hypothetical protein